ncbi:hypothetical protein BpHYR1_029022 [Brachionus plicatilis]|uniref:Uncharacterized protein n=1 Tax=Brachionus plicatilis TaxID=10195 RepID=A0A3M7SW46_BRAPC|nr:hypothetical protein BpHYR1_029022 [Brachionus plicatilis]
MCHIIILTIFAERGFNTTFKIVKYYGMDFDEKCEFCNLSLLYSSINELAHAKNITSILRKSIY